MDKAQTFNKFWNSFGMPAYDATSVPENASFPRITYTMATDNIDHTLLLDANLWYRESTWKNASQKIEEISEYIEKMSPIPCEGGYLRIMRGNPFAQRMLDEDDDLIRRYYINIVAEYLTAY